MKVCHEPRKELLRYNSVVPLAALPVIMYRKGVVVVKFTLGCIEDAPSMGFTALVVMVSTGAPAFQHRTPQESGPHTV